MSDPHHQATPPERLVLEASGLQVGYAGRSLLPAIDLAIEPGMFVVLVGPNGGGKSTLLRTLLGLLRPVGGSLSWGDDSHVSFVAQRSPHDPSVPGRVSDFVAGGLEHGWSFLRPRWRARGGPVATALERTGASQLARRRTAELSEGQRQRVLLARAIVCQPDIIVLDEPTAAMDANAQELTFELLRRLADEHGVAVVLATHQMALAARFATHAVMLDSVHEVAVAGPATEIWDHDAFTRRYGGWGARLAPPVNVEGP